MHRIFLVLALMVVEEVAGSACINGAESNGPCISGKCLSGYECLNSVCCAQALDAQQADVQDDDAATTPTTPTTPTTVSSTFNPLCVDGAINCGMFVAYCAFNDYLLCMIQHCGRTCGFCAKG
ncbi:unnamed protein product [Bursaphelenchus xylophilus]|uniref:(pine wood nematode) hypothetical protein n=1 Tax=Bursaphelenchus xylophilus TaxID=6326 RepID=A0A1I7RM84_BURXY|nr:unnamed protein product [Bursaphelenchus xylophilus]CAG9118288.1 unnamed protein product [Bursaphelenchus xylophilus]